MRWVEPSDFHITLRFIGDVSPSLTDDIYEALSAKQWHAPIIKLTEILVFGGSRPNSLYASISSSPTLDSLQLFQENLMRHLGIKPEKRKFTPHVTLGRCQQVSPENVANFITKKGLPLALPSFFSYSI